MTKKITKATIKSFIKKNKDNVLVKVISEFDGMVDGIEKSKNDEYKKIVSSSSDINELFVLGRNYFEVIDNEKYYGYSISNCCGLFELVIEK